LSKLLYDRHRVVGVSVETDGIVVAMTFPGHHCIGEYVIPYRNAISVNAGLGQCCSTFYTQGYAMLTLGYLSDSPRWGWSVINHCNNGQNSFTLLLSRKTSQTDKKKSDFTGKPDFRKMKSKFQKII
jgi:hypothetical protein